MNTLFSEAIKLKDGVLYNLDYHQMRVNRTLQQFFGTSIDLSVLAQLIPEDKKSGLYKCQVLYNARIVSVECTPYQFRSIQSVGVVNANHISYDYKYADRSDLNQLLEKSGCDDMILIKDRLVTDASFANLVFQSPNGLYTPTSYLLRGTKREYLLDKGLIQEREIRQEDLTQYERVFFINALIDLEDNISMDIQSLRYLT